MLVSLAAPHELLPALRLLMPGVADRAAVALARSERDPAGVFVACDGRGRVCGAVMVQALPGALGVAAVPRAGSVEVADELAIAACDWLTGRGVKVCQVFAPAADAPAVAPLERHGFRHVTQIVSMRREVPPDPPPSELSFVAETLPFSQALCVALLATHEDTRDCPELNGTRTADELLAGFADPASGETLYLARDDGQPVGVVMLAAAGPEIDLSYVGVMPSVRGRGFGGELVTFALAEAARTRAAMLSVAVDARNEPALRLYRRHGFAETDRCEVWLAHFPGEPGA